MIKSTTLGELASEGSLEFGDGYRTKRSELESSGIPILRVAEVQDGIITPTFTDHIRESLRSDIGPKISRPGDVVLTTKGTVGRVAVIPEGSAEFAYSPQVCYFRTTRSEPLAQKYLYYWLKSTEFWNQASHRMSQTDMAPYLNLTDIRSLRISIPDLKDQDSATAILGALDDKIAATRSVKSSCLDLANSLYEKLSISDTWRSIALQDSAQWISGGTPKTSIDEYWGGNIPWISAKSLKDPFVTQSERNLTLLGASSGTQIVSKDSIIFVVRGSSLKEEFRIGITQREVAFGQDCKALIAAEGIEPNTLFHAIRSRTTEILEMVDETGIGAGRLSTDLISKLDVRVPGSPSDRASEQLRLLNRQAANSQSEGQALANLRDTLLPPLMSGKLRVRDAEKIVEDAV